MSGQATAHADGNRKAGGERRSEREAYACLLLPSPYLPLSDTLSLSLSLSPLLRNHQVHYKRIKGRYPPTSLHRSVCLPRGFGDDDGDDSANGNAARIRPLSRLRGCDSDTKPPAAPRFGFARTHRRTRWPRGSGKHTRQQKQQHARCIVFSSILLLFFSYQVIACTARMEKTSAAWLYAPTYVQARRVGGDGGGGVVLRLGQESEKRTGQE